MLLYVHQRIDEIRNYEIDETSSAPFVSHSNVVNQFRINVPCLFTKTSPALRGFFPLFFPFCFVCLLAFIFIV